MRKLYDVASTGEHAPGAHPSDLRRAWIVFGCLACTILAFEALATRSARFLTTPHQLAAWAVLVDCGVIAPVVYWWLLIRPGHVPRWTVFSASLLGVSVAQHLLPDAQASALPAARFAPALLELAVILLVIMRVRRAIASARQSTSSEESTDVVQHISRAARAVLPVRRVANLIAYEMALVYYAFLSWRAPVSVPAHARSFTSHRRSGVIGLLAAVAAVLCIETFVGHLLLQRWSVQVAWIATALSAYGVLWTVGLVQSIRLRPTLLLPNTLSVRFGLLWNVDVPRHLIAGVARSAGALEGRTSTDASDVFFAAIGGDANVFVALHAPVMATGAYGRTRTVQVIGILVDEPEALSRALRADAGSATGESFVSVT